jgi:hypothetical protein
VLLISAHSAIILKIMFFIVLLNSDENNIGANCQGKWLLTE